MGMKAMFEEFFGMTATPFTNSIPSGNMYLSCVMKEALGRLYFAAQHRMFAVVTSDVGCGKTTTIRKFANDIDKQKYEVLYIANSNLRPGWFYKGMLRQMGVEPKFYRDAASRQLHHELEIIRCVQHREVICCELPQYDRADTGRYVASHLKYAGCEREIFTEKALDEVYHYSAGAARALNKVCMHSLICAAQRKENLIDDHLVRDVVESELP